MALPEAEARHCARVLRLEEGDVVEIFDGVGRVAQARLVEVDKRRVVVEPMEVRAEAPLPVRIALLVALIKGERFSWMIEKLTELGVSRVIPVMTARCVVRLDGREAAQRLRKWEATAVEAAKQCGNTFIPDILAPCTWDHALEMVQGPGLRLIGTLQADRRDLGVVLPEQGAGATEVCLAVGPEGDFTEAEVAAARGAGFLPVSFGRLVLRSETAALFAAAVLSQQLAGGVGGRAG